jgi:selenocysteine lyase/cysteine desulfurase
MMEELDVVSFFDRPPPGTVYLDTAGKSAIPQQARRAGSAAVERKSRPWLGIGSENIDDEVRDLYAQLINTTGDCVGIVPSTAFAMSVIANHVRAQATPTGGKVIVLQDEMGSAVIPWQYACDGTLLELTVVAHPRERGYEIDWANLMIESLAADPSSVRVIAVPAVHWCDGTVVDLVRIREFIDATYSHGMVPPLLVVDGTQSIGVREFDVKAIRPSYVACSVHKW